MRKLEKLEKKIEQNSKVLWIQESRRKAGLMYQASKIVSQYLLQLQEESSKGL